MQDPVIKKNLEGKDWIFERPSLSYEHPNSGKKLEEEVEKPCPNEAGNRTQNATLFPALNASRAVH